MANKENQQCLNKAKRRWQDIVGKGESMSKGVELRNWCPFKEQRIDYSSWNQG